LIASEAIVRAELFDAGTFLRKGTYGGGSLLDVKAKPGMEKGSYREIDFEYTFKNQTERIGEISRRMLTEPVVDSLAPWPLPFPARMWIDNTTRYLATNGGPILTAYHSDPWSSSFDPVPASETRLVVANRKEEVNREDANISELPDMEAIQARNPSPTEWLKLPVENEDVGFTNLKEQLVMMHDTDVEGGRITLSADFNPILAPFDFRHPEWYSIVDPDGETIATDPADVRRFLEFDPNGFYRLYIRPAQWRMVMTVVAHYIYISWFEAFPTDEVFTVAYFHRPPVYPKRHDILNPNYVFQGLIFDQAINEQWERTESSREMARQIIDAQWYTMSEAYIFAGNDPGELTVTQYAPNKDEFVAGIGRVDYPGGAQETWWVRQKADGESLNPDWSPQFINTCYVPWFVTPQAPGL
jgi:hypothetical protein